MKVKQLRRLLDTWQEEDQVLLYNGVDTYQLLEVNNTWEAAYDIAEDDSLDVGLRVLTPILEAKGFTEADVKTYPCIVIFPS